MLWLNEHKNDWRVVVLMIMPVAIAGPWFFDRINVPAEYTCSAPNIRLEGDFCGVPVTGLWLFRWGVPGFVYSSTELVKGAMTFLDWFRVLLFFLFLLLLVLPFISTLLLILRGDRRRRQVFSIVAWVLAAGIGSLGLLIGLSRYLRLFWVLWGAWLYIVLAVSALILEGLVLAAGKRPSHG